MSTVDHAYVHQTLIAVLESSFYSLKEVLGKEHDFKAISKNWTSSVSPVIMSVNLITKETPILSDFDFQQTWPF